MRHPLLIIIALLVLTVPTPGSARGDEAVLTAPKAFALAEAYEREGRWADAEALLKALTHDRNPDYRAEAHFRLGEERVARRDYTGAAQAFSALLEEKPDSKPARIQLARALALGGKTRAAERQLRRAEAGGLPEDVQRLVDRFSDVLRRSRPYGATIEFGLAPDTNINQATGARTLDIGGVPLTLDQNGRETSGIGLVATGEAFAALSVKRGISLVTRITGTSNFYRRGQFNDIYATASSGPEFSVGRDVVRAAATFTWRQIGGSRYSQGIGSSLQLSGPAGKTGQVGVTLSWSDQRYRITDQNGPQYAAQVSYEQAISPRLYGRIEASVARADALAAPYATTSYGIDASLSRDVGAATFYGSASYLRTDGDAAFALFGVARHDDRLDLSLGAGWNHLSIAGLTPVVRIEETINHSPVEIYRFKRTRLELALTDRF